MTKRKDAIMHGRAWGAGVWRVAALAVFLLLLGGCAARQAIQGPPWPREVIAGDWGELAEAESLDPLIPPYDPATGAGVGDQIKARFRGLDRKAAKISVVDEPAEMTTTISHLVESLVSDSDMRSHEPPIAREATSDRVEEEERQISVRAWIYAAKYEEDQDWHLIVGTDPDNHSRTFFNVEVSGLPPTSSSDYDDLHQVRKDLVAIVGEDDVPGPGDGYTKFPTPIPVLIEGSLFFDMAHAAGVVGPAGMRPQTAWEIHPATKLKPRNP